MEKKYSREKSHLKIELTVECKDENIQKEALEAKLDTVFNRIFSFENIEQIIVWIRTLFQDMEEKNLKVEVGTINENIVASYKKRELVRVEIEGKQSQDNKRILLKTCYDKDHGICFSAFTNSSKPICIPVKQYEENSKKAFKTIKSLENASAIKLQEKDKTIWEFYKLFYEENPDFSSEDLSIKIQTMLCILVRFNISLGYGFDHTLLDNKMPFSLALQYDLDRLIPLGEVQEIEEPVVQMTKRRKKEIECIGKLVRKYTKGDLNNLIQLSTIIYGSRYDLSQNTNVEDVSLFTGYTNGDIEESIQLVRRIEEKIEEACMGKQL